MTSSFSQLMSRRRRIPHHSMHQNNHKRMKTILQGCRLKSRLYRRHNVNQRNSSKIPSYQSAKPDRRRGSARRRKIPPPPRKRSRRQTMLLHQSHSIFLQLPVYSTFPLKLSHLLPEQRRAETRIKRRAKVCTLSDVLMQKETLTVFLAAGFQGNFPAPMTVHHEKIGNKSHTFK